MMGTSVEFFIPAGRQRAAARGLPDGRRHRHEPGAWARALASGSSGVRRPRPLLETTDGRRRQRRGARELDHSQPCVLSRDRRRHESDVGAAVQGVGSANRDQIEKVFYRGFTSMLPSNATFAVARAATIQSARDLYGAGSAAERAVTQAWTAVGVN